MLRIADAPGLGVQRRELRLIAEHRRVATGDLRIALMAVEARWAVHVAWLCEDTGDCRGRDALLDRALRLARAADHPDLIAWSHARQAQWTDPSHAGRIAETGLRTARAGAHTRALCAVRAAHAHANLGNTEKRPSRTPSQDAPLTECWLHGLSSPTRGLPIARVTYVVSSGSALSPPHLYD
jgi:hypothetical protein